MIKRRDTPDGLPYRLYERFGVNKYSIGYKLESGKWAFRLQCPVHNQAEIAKLKREAIQQAAQLAFNSGQGGVIGLIDGWIEWQEKLPVSDLNKRADSTLKENKREAENLKKSFGHLEPHQITMVLGYEYLDACVSNKRAAKGNKEIALFQVILEFAVRKGVIDSNPLRGIRKNKTVSQQRYVTDEEIEIAYRVGKEKGGSRLIVALALRTAWLCVRRSVEVRAITRDAITDAGIMWKAGKVKIGKEKPPVLIEWTPELRDTIQQAINIKRNHVAGSMYIFGNMRGQRYTKGGWKSILDDLMQDCVTEAEKLSIEFKPFSLQDCRPKGVSDKLDSGHTDVQSATGHTTDRMIGQIYDRRRIKKATPVK
jgi:integrase